MKMSTIDKEEGGKKKRTFRQRQENVLESVKGHSAFYEIQLGWNIESIAEENSWWTFPDKTKNLNTGL